MENKPATLKKLIKFGRMCYAKDLVLAAGGNISARTGDTIYITRRGASLGKLTAEDFIPIKLKGKTLHPRRQPSAEFRLHIACFRARPDIRAVIHTHPAFSTALANAGVSLKDFTYELSGAIGSDVPCLKFIIPGTEVLAKEVGRRIKKANGLLLPKHGIVTVGKDVEEAFHRSLALERASKTYIFNKILQFIGKA